MRANRVTLDNITFGIAYDWFGLVSFMLILLGSIAISVFSYLRVDGSDLEIYVQWQRSSDTSGLVTGAASGRVQREGTPVVGAEVWAVVRDARGNRNSPPSVTTDQQGLFRIDAVPLDILGDSITAATVYARSADDSGEYRGQEAVALIGGRQLRNLSLSGWSIAYVPGVFLASILLAFVNVSLRLKHNLSLVLALAFTVIMIFALSVALSLVNTSAQHGDVLSLGFASIFHGTYVDGGAPEWIFSFTSPDPVVGVAESAGDGGTIPTEAVSGFGAPLWVLLLGVVGAALKTVQIIVREITDRPQYDITSPSDVENVRSHIQEIVRHQFYILFAPLGAIFVYQALVVGEAANNAFTVALAALGAGVSLNALLEAAINRATQAARSRTGGGGDNHGGTVNE